MRLQFGRQIRWVGLTLRAKFHKRIFKTEGIHDDLDDDTGIAWAFPKDHARPFEVEGNPLFWANYLFSPANLRLHEGHSTVEPPEDETQKTLEYEWTGDTEGITDDPAFVRIDTYAVNQSGADIGEIDYSEWTINPTALGGQWRPWSNSLYHAGVGRPIAVPEYTAVHGIRMRVQIQNCRAKVVLPDPVIFIADAIPNSNGFYKETLGN